MTVRLPTFREIDTNAAGLGLLGQVEKTKKPLSFLPSIAPQKRTYLSFNCPGMALEAVESEFEQNLAALQTRIVRLGLPILPALKQETNGRVLHFPKESREYLLAISRLDPKLQQFLRNAEKNACFQHRGKLETSVKGLRETASSVKALNLHLNQVIAEANSYFKLLDSVTPVKSKINPHKQPIRSIFKKFEGLCVGERHNGIAPKKFLIDKMDYLKKQGVITLFIETLSYDLQEQLDEYLASENSELPSLLKAALEAKDSANHLSGPYTYTNLVKKAKELGIRIVGVDTTEAYEAGQNFSNPRDSMNRLRVMNYLAERIIRHEKGKGKYVVFVGSWHAATFHSKDGLSIGLAELLRIPSMIIMDQIKGKSSLKIDVKGKESGHPDLADLDHIHILSEKSPSHRENN